MGKSSNKKTTFRPPSCVDALPFPVFGLTWYGSPSSSSSSYANAATGGGSGGVSAGGAGGVGGGGGGGGCSVIAYCGGGGSAKTGVGNKIVVLITTTATTTATPAENGIDDEDDGGGAPTVATAFDSTPRTEQRQIEISTGDALCFGVHAFYPPRENVGQSSDGDNINSNNNNNNMVRLLACVGDEILLYGIPLTSSSSSVLSHQQHTDDGNETTVQDDEAILLGKTNVGNSYGASVASYSTLLCRTTPGKLIHCIAVGCENGTIVIFHLHPSNKHHTSSSSSSPTSSTAGTTYHYEFTKVCECIGHTKAICAISFHPRGNMHQLLTSAKDGTARIFNIDNGEEMSVMQCEVHDPKLAPPPPPASAETSTATTTTTTTDPRMMKRPPQILVRGCAYGDLEGKVIYTVASGKRGPAYLTKWRTTAMSLGSAPPPPPPSSSSAGNSEHQQQPQPTTPQQQQSMSIAQEYRMQCSPVPISATSLSSDGTLLTLGSVEGSVLLYNLSTCTIQKEFKLVHDLPVTCVASRPIPNALYLPGELEEGVSFDAISASADNRLGRWTLQSKSRIIASSSMRGGGGSSFQKHQNPVVAFIVDYFVRIPLLLTLLLITLAVWDAMDICRSEFSVSALIAGGKEGITMAGRCFYREVLWAEESRVSFVPE